MVGHAAARTPTSFESRHTVQLRPQRTEDVRARAQQIAAGTQGSSAQLVDLAAGEAVVVTTAWAAFVPFLAHPVTASSARTGMELLDNAVDLLSQPRPLVA